MEICPKSEYFSLIFLFFCAFYIKICIMCLKVYYYFLKMFVEVFGTVLQMMSGVH